LNKREITTTNYVPFENFPDLMTVYDMQNALGVGRNVAYRLIRDGSIQSIKIGRSVRVPKAFLIDFVYGVCYNTPVVSGLAQ
jgi:excisionase family DNA binding protein